MDLLGIRDEDDYEKLVIKEALSENSSIMQILGTLEIHHNSVVDNDTSSLFSVVSSSNCSPFLRLFIGTAPFQIKEDQVSCASTHQALQSGQRLQNNDRVDIPCIQTESDNVNTGTLGDYSVSAVQKKVN